MHIPLMRRSLLLYTIAALLALSIILAGIVSSNKTPIRPPDHPFPSLLNSLPWPVKHKGVEDCHLFFNEEDAVERTKHKAGIRRCSDGHFPIHLALDIVGQEGEKVYFVNDGTIKKVGIWGETWGGYVVTEHQVDNKRFTLLYGHIKPYSDLVEGHTIAQGELLGELDDLTDTTNDLSHLHFGMRGGPYDEMLSDRGVTYCDEDLLGFLDPVRYLKTDGFVVIDRPLEVPPGWKQERAISLYQGDGYYYYSSLEESTLIFESPILKPGSYGIYVRFPPYRKASDRVKIEVSGINVLSVVFFDQTTPSSKGRWVFHSQQLLKEASNIKTIFHGSSRGHVTADAVLIKTIPHKTIQ